MPTITRALTRTILTCLAGLAITSAAHAKPYLPPKPLLWWPEDEERCLAAIRAVRAKMVAPDSVQPRLCVEARTNGPGMRVIVVAKNIFGATVEGSFIVRGDDYVEPSTADDVASLSLMRRR